MDSHVFLTNFVKIIEQHPVLYDPKLPQHTPHHCRVAWENVAEKVRNDFKQECTVDELKSKWKGIRSSFARYTRQLRRSKDKNSTKQYYLYDTLKFLIPHSKTYNKRRFSETERNDEQSSEADEWDSEMVHMFSDDVIDHTNSSDSLALPLHSNSLVFPEVKIEPVEDEHAADTTNVIHENDLQPETDSSMKNKAYLTYEAKTSKAQNTEENVDLQFFRSILPDIIHFTNYEKRKFKVGVLKLIDDIENSRPDFKLHCK